ncbi:MAG: 1,4-dihydroxy-2-naphthoate octaprenyltransferase [Flavobacteriales bacterium]
MSSLTSWIAASRPRTLPLSLSGIIVGISLQINEVKPYPWVALGCLFTTVFFQILSNFANDYGDGIKGTDNADRIGPTRAIQSGSISVSGMKKAIIILSFFSALSAISTVFLASPMLGTTQIISYGILAVLCILAAILYTVGRSAYGYRGLGDLMVFLFFGLVAVLGTMNLYPRAFWFEGSLGALSIGCWSVLVLNLNNLRDVANDRKANKNTLVVQFGVTWGRLYHHVLLVTGIISWCVLLMCLAIETKRCSPLIAILPSLLLIKHLIRFRNIAVESQYDPELKKVAIATFLHAIALLLSCFLPF